jgi:uncharacterized protein (DUF2336 family)
VSVMSEEFVAGLDVSVLTAVLEEGDAAARMTLARQLAMLLADDETPKIEREQVTPIVLKLTVDPARDVRVLMTMIFRCHS